MAKTALVVIDVQNGFVNERSRHVVPAVAGLVQRWEQAGGDTVFTRFQNRPDSPYVRLLHWSRLQTSPETDIVDELAPCAQRARAVIDKPVYTMFTAEGAQLVRDHGWTDLVFCGIATEGCVLKSAVDAFERGYTPWVVRDACASHAGEAAHRAGLLVAGRFIGGRHVVDRATLVAALPRRAGRGV